MVDPLAEVVAMLQPVASMSKVVTGAGEWRIRRAEPGLASYFVILEGTPHLAIDDGPSCELQAGDFVLIPSADSFTMASDDAVAGSSVDCVPVAMLGGGFRLGRQDGAADVVVLVGHCVFASPDAALLVSLLPQVVHVPSEPRLSALVHLIGDETRAARPARDMVLGRLLEVMLIEALRSTAHTAASTGLMRGLSDARLALALRAMHADPTAPWTVPLLAREAALSRSAFFARFRRALGVPPMDYLLAWRMALGKDMLRHPGTSISEVAARVGYGSASAFSVAFRRHAGQTPVDYLRAHRPASPSVVPTLRGVVRTGGHAPVG